MRRLFWLIIITFTVAVHAGGKMEERLKKQFIEAVETGDIVRLCRDRNSWSVPFFALGGKLFWETVTCREWKFQVSKVNNNWRIVDPNGIRRARGYSAHALDEFFRGHPSSLKESYSLEGNHFYRYPGTNNETVVLIHGWNVRSYYISRMAVFLQSKGYNVLNYDYATSKLDIAGHAKQFLELYRAEKIQGKVHFVTHSMGSLVIRYALADMTEQECKQIDSVIMMGPPNGGSGLAVIGKPGFVRKYNHSLADMAPGSPALKIPLPVHYPPVGIIAGSHDEKVSFKNTTLPDDIPFQRTTVRSNHPDLRSPKKTGDAILKFFREKKFD